MNDFEEPEKPQLQPCEDAAEALPRERAAALAERISGWRLDAEGKVISRKFEFGDFDRTMAFINALARVAREEDHHPDFSAGYNYCEVGFTTHAVGGLSARDFICAARVNALAETMD